MVFDDRQGCVRNRDEVYLGESMLLTGAAIVLDTMITNEPYQRKPGDLLQLRQVSELFYNGLAHWERKNGQRTCSRTGADQEEHAFNVIQYIHGDFGKLVRTTGVTLRYEDIRRALATLNAIAVGQFPVSESLAQARDVCVQICRNLPTRSRQGCWG